VDKAKNEASLSFETGLPAGSAENIDKNQQDW
jgi:hypothetical protein